MEFPDDPLEQLSFNEFRIRLTKDYRSQRSLTKAQKVELDRRLSERLEQYVDAGGVPRQWETVLIWQ